MSKHDLAARPIYHHLRDSIEAHLTIVLAALAISRFIEERTRWSIASSCAPPAATALSRSRPALTPSPPPTRYPTICAAPSTSSTPQCALNEPTRVL